MRTSTVRILSMLTIVGAITWSYGWLQAGVLPEDVMDQTEIAAGGAFQIGLLALLATMRVTDAMGPSRWRRYLLNAEIVAVVLAFMWTVPFGINPNRSDTAVLMVLDVFWPLSMVGLIVVGVAVLRAARWPVPARYLPLVASLLIPVDIILMMLGLGAWAQIVVRAVYLAVAYTLVGLAVWVQVAPLAEGRASPRPRLAGGTG